MDLVLHVEPQVEELREQGTASCIAMGKKTFQCVDSGWSPRKQDAKGNGTPKSEAIESSFQRNPRGSFTFNMGSEIYEINFRGEVYIKRNMTGVCLVHRYDPYLS